MPVKPAGKINTKLIRRYSPHAEVMIRDQIPHHLLKTREKLSLSHEVELMSAFFAHIRLQNHSEQVTDFRSEFRQALKDRVIRSILEIGVSGFSFVRYFSDLKPPAARIFLYGEEIVTSFNTQDFVSGRGDLFQDFNLWFPGQKFDMIFAFGIPEYALLSFSINFENQILQANKSALEMTNRLSDNPNAAFFVSSLKSGLLAFVKSEIKKGAEINFWKGKRARMITSWQDIYRHRYKCLPASIVVLSKKAQTALRF